MWKGFYQIASMGSLCSWTSMLGFIIVIVFIYTTDCDSSDDGEFESLQPEL